MGSWGIIIRGGGNRLGGSCFCSGTSDFGADVQMLVECIHAYQGTRLDTGTKILELVKSRSSVYVQVMVLPSFQKGVT